MRLGERRAMAYYGHSSGDGRFQPLAEHLRNTAACAAGFAQAFGAEEAAYALGLAHDIGKYTEKFQAKLRGAAVSVDHSTAAAKELLGLKNPTLAKLLAYCAAGHHCGLPDGGGLYDSAEKATLEGRLKRKTEDCSAYHTEISISEPAPPNAIKPLGAFGFTLSFFTRMLFSCLVDGDYLDTGIFMNGRRSGGLAGEIGKLKAKLDKYLEAFKNPKREIDVKRCEVLDDCIKASSGERGLYTLTVPTGGGKTISSLAFALNHAEKRHLKRAIYIIPYTSIIEQTASVFSDILDPKHVLAHYSTAEFNDADDETSPKKLAAQNWDAPLIVTTAVQFFESLFSNKPAQCRKLHNIAESVLIFDEAQMLPLQYLKPCVRAIAELIMNYGCSAVLCTATQPALGKFFLEISPELLCHEICGNPYELSVIFRRTSLRHIGLISASDLAARLVKYRQALCIVNTRKQAEELFDLLPKGGSYHLSTMMTPVHRKRVLKAIKKRLIKKRICRVVATSLIEAGVDVDFPVVFRAEAGLDSILQAAGRCNREGRREADESLVNVFIPQKGESSLFKQNIKLFGLVRDKYPLDKDLSSLEAINYYFDLLHKAKGDELDRDDIIRAFEDGYKDRLSFPFKSVADSFRLIDTSTKQVFIPIDVRAKRLKSLRSIETALKNHNYTKNVLSRASKYMVGVWPRHFDFLVNSGAAWPVEEDLAILVDLKLYDAKKGLSLAKDEGSGLFI